MLCWLLLLLRPGAIVTSKSSYSSSNHHQWTVCDVTQPPFVNNDNVNTHIGTDEIVREQQSHITEAVVSSSVLIQEEENEERSSAYEGCNEILIPKNAIVVSSPFNLSSNQVLTVNGILKASTHPHDYPIIAPILGYGWSDDTNCFLKNQTRHKVAVGALRYAPFIGSFNTSNITIRGIGTIDGQGESWYSNCSACHYDDESDLCLQAGRPKLVEFQHVNGIHIYGGNNKYVLGDDDSSSEDSSSLTLKNSPFWTITPSYSQNIHIENLNMYAPVNRIGNTDGINLDSCRNAWIRNIYMNNGDDGIALKSGLNGFGLNLAIPTENVVVENITTEGRGGFALGSEMSGGLRNITFRNSRLLGERGINIKPSVGRGGYIDQITFENIDTGDKTATFGIGNDGTPLMPNNDYVPLISNIHFNNVSHVNKLRFQQECQKANQSKCFGVTVIDRGGNYDPICPETLPKGGYACKTAAYTRDYDHIQLAWPVCIPKLAPVNIRPDYYNWGPTYGSFKSLKECQRLCQGNNQNNEAMMESRESNGTIGVVFKVVAT